MLPTMRTLHAENMFVLFSTLKMALSADHKQTIKWHFSLFGRTIRGSHLTRRHSRYNQIVRIDASLRHLHHMHEITATVRQHPN